MLIGVRYVLQIADVMDRMLGINESKNKDNKDKDKKTNATLNQNDDVHVVGYNG